VSEGRPGLPLEARLSERPPVQRRGLVKALGVSGALGAMGALAALAPLGLAVVPGPARAAAPAPASFALIGDVPYGSGEETKLARVIDAINASHAAGGVQWVVHTGDVKRSRERCDDRLLQRRFDLFRRLVPPFVITPGDNDWTDCHRVPSGRYLPVERLARLRQIFYPRPGLSSAGRAEPVLTQALAPGQADAHRAHVENQCWSFAGVTMATVHVVGSHNGLEPWDDLDPADREDRPRPDRLADFKAREAAAVAWIDTAFDHAQAHGHAGVVIAMQANPGLHRTARDPARRGFNQVLDRLTRRAAAFGRPVLLAHGDTHTYRFDAPLAHAAAHTRLPRLANLRRVENFGSPQVHWVEVRVDASTAEVFTAVPHYVLANLLPF